MYNGEISYLEHDVPRKVANQNQYYLILLLLT